MHAVDQLSLMDEEPMELVSSLESNEDDEPPNESLSKKFRQSSLSSFFSFGRKVRGMNR